MQTLNTTITTTKTNKQEVSKKPEIMEDRWGVGGARGRARQKETETDRQTQRRQYIICKTKVTPKSDFLIFGQKQSAVVHVGKTELTQ